MSQSYDLFCRWKHVKKIQSDNAGAIALGVTRATVSSWKQGKNAEIQYIEQMALEIGDSPETWSALVMAERSNSEAEKAAWKRIAQKLASVAMALALGVGLASPRDVQAAVGGFDAAPSIHYAKCRNGPSGPSGAVCRLRLALDQTLDRLLLPYSSPNKDEIQA
ncbi:DUF3693 domain-containing protein [Stenotrophomonas sp.]|uniref:DUF3693 domain-containing protein n=1 Tax=Stenotrophomonas sp. TaxID=69392 RepID=UPI002FCBEEF6